MLVYSALIFVFVLAQEALPPTNQPQQPTPPGDSSLPSPTQSPEKQPADLGKIVTVSYMAEVLKGAKEQIDVLSGTLTEEALATALHQAALRGVKIRILVPANVISLQTSYVLTFIYLQFKHPVTVKIIAGTKVDPRVIVDKRIMFVGQPIDGVLPEIGGPLLMFVDKGIVQKELERFDSYWKISPKCIPNARYDLNNQKLIVKCNLIR